MRKWHAAKGSWVWQTALFPVARGQDYAHFATPCPLDYWNSQRFFDLGHDLPLRQTARHSEPRILPSTITPQSLHRLACIFPFLLYGFAPRTPISPTHDPSHHFPSFHCTNTACTHTNPKHTPMIHSLFLFFSFLCIPSSTTRWADKRSGRLSEINTSTRRSGSAYRFIFFAFVCLSDLSSLRCGSGGVVTVILH